MSFFNSNITGAGGSGGLVTKFVKSVTIGSTETAEIQISLKDDISNYADINNEQIIVDISNVGASEAGTANITQSYDAESGVLTITSDSSKLPFIVDSTVEIIVYVAGAVQLPPVPEVSTFCYLFTGTSIDLKLYNIDSSKYNLLTTNNFIPILGKGGMSGGGGVDYRDDVKISVSSAGNIAFPKKYTDGVFTTRAVSVGSYSCNHGPSGSGTATPTSILIISPFEILGLVPYEV